MSSLTRRGALMLGAAMTLTLVAVDDGMATPAEADAEIANMLNKAVVCTSCHLAQFQGDSSVPRLADQERDYLFKTMMDFRNHTRGNNPGMSAFMNVGTSDQLAAMASYLAGL